MLVTTAVLVTYGVLALAYTIVTYYTEFAQDFFYASIVIAFGLAAGILCITFDIRKAIGKNHFLFIAVGMAGILVFYLASVFFDLQYVMRYSNEAYLYGVGIDWLGILQYVCIFAFILGFGGWMAFKKRRPAGSYTGYSHPNCRGRLACDDKHRIAKGQDVWRRICLFVYAAVLQYRQEI